MISASQKKFITSLRQKKNRIRNNSFVVEGVKMVEELIQSNYEIESIFHTKKWLKSDLDVNCIEISEKELNFISSLKTPNKVLAVVKKKQSKLFDVDSQLTIALESVKDPGNLGTIIRTADWFGVKNIVCSNDSVDVFNPKVMQATMGSFFRTNVVYTDLKDFFLKNNNLNIYGALLSGENIYNKDLIKKGSVILMGNESKGISEELISFITDRVSIPRNGEAESLNVAIATAIICSEYKRRE